MSTPAALASALPQYEVGVKIGSGGMGVVFEGTHRSLGRAVAIKVLPTDLVGDPSVNARFDREARVLASLDHPHIVPVYDYVQTGADNLLVMEKLDGGTVYDRFHGVGLTGEQSCAIVLAMLGGLHAAHKAGVLHLDVKPKNLLFTSAGVLKVVDFGIAQVVSEGATMMTHAGEVLGTPAYIAPEQAMGNALTPAADIYSSGTVLYELLCGELPYDRTRGAVSMMRQRIFNDPAPIPRVPAPLATVVMRSIARDPLHRYRDVEAFATDLSSAATAVFGAGWLERSGVPVHLAPRITGAISQQLSRQPDALTIVTPPIRGMTAEPTRTMGDFRGKELRPASELMSRRGPSPLWPALIATVALIALVVLPFLSPATLDHPPSALMVNGQVADKVVQVDLSKQIIVAGRAPGDVELRFDLRAGGVLLGRVRKVIATTPEGTFETTFKPEPLWRWLAGGAVTAEVQLGDDPVETFTLRSAAHPMATVMGAGSLLLSLFALANVEAQMRALRRGHRRPAAPYVAFPLGLLFGLTVWLFITAITTHEPAIPYAIGTALAGAIAASAFVLATAWSARRSRA
ncbi:serine/threonine-protein kinase [Actinokineospora globicatena]|uniref:non-specific serine/threonine protein kinase n=1 Tax=Actinokineospora globicatena TaxID=103729 RepID=A0A9W6QS39_9PSEU|nr:serine/threonine-protein kinase [Actinokineospora globicatena]GLW95543.1 serine/threonine protein kinase [Actinokineospora globicatena]